MVSWTGSAEAPSEITKSSLQDVDVFQTDVMKAKGIEGIRRKKSATVGVFRSDPRSVASRPRVTLFCSLLFSSSPLPLTFSLLVKLEFLIKPSQV